MLSAVIAFVFGAFEALILRKLLLAATSGNYNQIVLYLMVKLATYAIAISLLIFFFSQYILNCVIGYSVGLPVITIVWFIYRTLHEKDAEAGDDQNENNNYN